MKCAVLETVLRATGRASLGPVELRGCVRVHRFSRGGHRLWLSGGGHGTDPNTEITVRGEEVRVIWMREEALNSLWYFSIG